MKIRSGAALALFVVLTAASCVSSPKPAKAPDWILTTPPPDATYTYFVAASSDAKGDAAVATDDAANALIAQITRFMGVKITVESTGEAKGTLDSYSANVTNVVKQSGSSQVSGFSIKDRYQVKEGTAVTVYILAQYATVELNKEKARIAAVFKEQEDAVAKPEAAGDAAASAGRAFDAVKSYVEAVVAASGSGVDNAAIKLERNANKARTVLGRLRFVSVGAPTTANIGKEFGKPFQAKLVFGEGDSAPGIPGAEVFVTYQRRQSSGRVVTRTERAMTDGAGLVSFTPPPPDFVGKATMSFALNLESTSQLLDKVPAAYAAIVDAIRDDLSRRSVSFQYLIASEAKTVPTGVAVVDLNDEGKPAGTSVAQGGLFETLAKEKFKAGLAPLDGALVASLDDAAILKAAKAQYSAGISRLIYGTAKIDSVTKDGSMWQAAARMTVRCVDFATGAVLYSVEKTSIVVASDEASAKRSALLQVGRDAVAKDLMANLP